MKKSFFETFKNNAVLLNATENYSTYTLDYNNIKYTILKTSNKANMHTVIRLECDKILWEQYFPLGNRPSKEVNIISRKNFNEKNTIGLAVIYGKPQMICGLDENGYVSTTRKHSKETDTYVMTFDDLRGFEP